MLPAFVAPTLAVGGQAVGRRPTRFQPRERRLQRASRRIHGHRLGLSAHGEGAARARHRAGNRRVSRCPAVGHARDRDGAAKRQLDDGIHRQSLALRGSAPHHGRSLHATVRSARLSAARSLWRVGIREPRFTPGGDRVAIPRDERHGKHHRGQRRLRSRVRQRRVGCVAASLPDARPPIRRCRSSRRTLHM